jgi:mono/diheme cytochrome c family protein
VRVPRAKRHGIGAAAALALLLGVLAGCDRMANQAKEKAYRSTPTSAELRPAGVVPRRAVDGTAPPVTAALLDRGHERFDIFCAPCHGRVGDGSGMIVQRGFPQPPSLHIDRLRTAAPRHFFDVITDGYGAMYSYAARLSPADRWAVAAYIRALQTSQDAKLADVPADQRGTLR